MTTAPTPIFHPNLPLAVIVESVHNPRKRYDADALQELAETIRARGIHNPVLVRKIGTPAGPRFELAAGHRRCRAARLVGLVEVPALIMPLDDRGFLELLHLDNLQRDDVDPLDEALGYEQLLTNGYDVAMLADKIGKSITYVASRVRLLSLGVAAREAMRLGYVKVSHAIELAKLPEGAQEQLLESEWNLNPSALARSAGMETPTADAADEADDATDPVPEDDEDEELDPEEFAAPKATDRWLRARFYEEISEPTLLTLKRAIAHDVLRKLSVVQWDLNDATLVPEAGACASCPKRSSQEPLLFPELDREDACLDASCYEAKAEALFQLTRGVPTAAAGAPSTRSAAVDPATSAAREAETAKAKAEREARDQQVAARQQKRLVLARTVLQRVPKTALTQREWLVAVFATLLKNITDASLERVLTLLELSDELRDSDEDEVHQRVLTWANEPHRTVGHLTRAIVLLLMAYDLRFQPWHLQYEVKTPTLDRFAELAGVTVLDADAPDSPLVAAVEEPAPSKPRRRAAARVTSPATTGVQ